MFAETRILFSFLNCGPSPQPSPRLRGEGEDLEWTRNPGFRWRSTLGYKYFAPNGAGRKHSAILTSDSWL